MTNNIICEIIISGFAVYGFIIALYEIKCWCLRQSKRKRKTENVQSNAENTKNSGDTNSET